MHPAIKFAIAWFVLGILLVFALGRYTVSTYVRLLQRGASANATVVEQDCENGSRALYTFNVGSVQYSNSDSFAERCLSLHPGDHIAVYYDTADPTISRAVEPKAGLVNELVTIGFIGLLLPPFVIAAALGLFRRNSAAAPQ